MANGVAPAAVQLLVTAICALAGRWLLRNGFSPVRADAGWPGRTRRLADRTLWPFAHRCARGRAGAWLPARLASDRRRPAARSRAVPCVRPGAPRRRTPA